MGNFAIFFLAVASFCVLSADCGLLMGKLNPNFKLDVNNKGSEMVGASAPRRLPNLLQISRRDSTAQTREQCERCSTTKLCSLNMDLCPRCKSICQSLDLPATPDVASRTTDTKDTDGALVGDPHYAELPLSNFTDQYVQIDPNNNNRYIALGSIEPPKIVWFLGRIFGLSDAAINQIDKMIILAKPKVAEPTTQPLIVDTGRAFMNTYTENASIPLIFGLANVQSLNSELAREANRELDRAIENKRILLDRNNFTRSELERIIGEVEEQMSKRKSPEDEVGCSLEEKGLVEPVIPVNYQYERKPEVQAESGRLNPPIRQDKFTVGSPEEIRQRTAMADDFPETLTVSQEMRSRPESDDQRIRELRKKFDSSEETGGSSSNSISDSGSEEEHILKRPSATQNVTEKIPHTSNGKFTLVRVVNKPQESNRDFPERKFELETPIVESPQNLRDSEESPIRDDLENAVARVVEDSLKIPEVLNEDPNVGRSIDLPNGTIFQLIEPPHIFPPLHQLGRHNMTPHELYMMGHFRNISQRSGGEDEEAAVTEPSEVIFRLKHPPHVFPPLHQLGRHNMTPHELFKMGHFQNTESPEEADKDSNLGDVIQPTERIFRLLDPPNLFPPLHEMEKHNMTPHELYEMGHFKAGDGEFIIGEPTPQIPINQASFGSLQPLNPEDGNNEHLPYKKVRFLGKDINLPLRMYKDGAGGYQLRVDVDEFCSCKNSTCTRRHLDERQDLLGETESLSDTNLPELQLRFNEAASEAQKNVAKRSVDDNKIDKEADGIKKSKDGEQVITPVKDLMKFYNVEKVLGEKLLELDNDVKVFMEENENLLNKGTLSLMRHFQTEKSVKDAVELVASVLVWMKNITDTNN